MLTLIECFETRARELLRPADPSKDVWVGPAPTRTMILDRIKGDKDIENLLFNWSMAEFLDKFLTNEKLKLGLYGQGIIFVFGPHVISLFQSRDILMTVNTFSSDERI
jgi:hypothetical protein